MVKLLEVVKLHESFKLKMWDHRLPFVTLTQLLQSTNPLQSKTPVQWKALPFSFWPSIFLSWLFLR